MCEAITLRRRELEDLDRIEAVATPAIEAYSGRRFARLRANRTERRALAAIMFDRFEAAEIAGEAVDETKGPLARFFEWLSEPENREKLIEIIEWFISMLARFGAMPV